MGTTTFQRISILSIISFLAVMLHGPKALAQEERIPDSLKVWKEWVLWEGSPQEIPHPYNDANTSLTVWPSTLAIQVQGNSASWTLAVQVYRKTYFSLPGDADSWPRNVRASSLIATTSPTPESNAVEDVRSTLVDVPLVVLPKNDVPVVELPPGSYKLTGEFQWTNTATKVAIPKSIGIVELTLDGNAVPFPNWDSSGFLWLSRSQSEVTEQNRISVKVYRYLEDGIPSWLRTQIDLSVSGKSREEDLGHLLPEGWVLAEVESPLPIAVDEQSRAKVQVRPGNWSVLLRAFRVTPLTEFRFAAGTTPAVDVELIGLKTQPEFRMIEFQGVPSVDVQQTTYPDSWRNLPVFQWTVNTPFTITEKIRGMGDLKPEGLSVSRSFWLDDNGEGITYRDVLVGKLQQTWRLDAAPNHELGAVRIGQERQLITANPTNNSPGIEVRSRNPEIFALGRIENASQIAASGWLADTDRLSVEFSLPPGWRMWTVLGADNVSGDWLTAWTLMDLFLVLIFSLAIYRLYGIPAGLLALVAFGLSYHEPDSPRWTWIFLLVPLALLKVLPNGTGQKIVRFVQWSAVALLLVFLVPFLAKQIEFAIYPQLESADLRYGERVSWLSRRSGELQVVPAETTRSYAVNNLPSKSSEWQSDGAQFDSLSNQVPSLAEPQSNAAQVQQFSKQTSNLKIDPAARTQTGPALPDWNANTVYCSWDGPVTPEQMIHPIYLSRNGHRVLAVVRSLLLLLLLAIITTQRNLLGVFGKPAKTVMAALPPQATSAILCVAGLLFGNNVAQAQFPDPQLLEQLRERLTKPSDAFPQAADIANLDINIQDNRITLKLEVHAAELVAIPLPGKFPAWAPRSVRWEPSPNSAASTASAPPAEGPHVSRTDDGTLWMLVQPGVQTVAVEGLLSDNNEWVLGFSLTPRSITVNAPQWQVVGLQGNKAPGNQLFFTRVEKGNEQAVKFDQRIFKPVVQVERRVELGLIWKVYTTVKRLSAHGKAISLNVPLMPEERVVTSAIDTNNGQIEVNLEPTQSLFTWESELPFSDQLAFEAANSDQYVERWILESSPVWNVEMNGVKPFYETESSNLIPVWQVWPGEKLTLAVKRPTAIAGETLTVQKVSRTIDLGVRQRKTTLLLDVESSLGGDFKITLSPTDEVNELQVNNRPQPARRVGDDLIIALEPGVQKIKLTLEAAEPLGISAAAHPVSLPVKSANIRTSIQIPYNRWILWADGPLRGPAVRLWIFLASAIVFAICLTLRGNSPLKSYEWLLLAIGLTQLHAVYGLVVVGWLYLLAWRNTRTPTSMNAWSFNFLQLFIVGLTLAVLMIFVGVVGKGLLGQPEMFITGNGSYSNELYWFEPQSSPDLSQPYVITVSLWYYRLFMLLWALWLASAVLRWLVRGWQAFSHGGRWHMGKRKTRVPEIVTAGEVTDEATPA